MSSASSSGSPLEMSGHPEEESRLSSSTTDRDYPWKKKIIVCCDGTGQKASPPVSNVLRIYNCISAHDGGGAPQVNHYQAGIGTGSIYPIAVVKQALGLGIDGHIRMAYRFICEEYESDRSMICLIGYSRGAYTVRCVAQLIQDVGLLRPNAIHLLPKIFARWRKNGSRVSDEPLVQDNSRSGVRIQVCAVWDTVSSLCLPPPRPRYGDFVNSTLSHNIDEAIQALALHERRHHFLPIVWRSHTIPPIPDFLHQCWFAGYHCDIGGGRKDEFLAHIALIWMMAKLAGFLEFDLERLWDYEPPVSSWRVNGEVQEGSETTALVPTTFSGKWFIGGSTSRKPRRHFWIPQFDSKTVPGPDNSRERIHRTVDELLDRRIIDSCDCLYGADRPFQEGDDAGRCAWRLRMDRNNPTKKYDVPEDGLKSAEAEWIGRWARKELEIIQRSSSPTDQPPRTKISVLLHLLAMVWDFQREEERSRE